MQAAECMTRGVRLGVRKYLGDDSWKKYFAASYFCCGFELWNVLSFPCGVAGAGARWRGTAWSHVVKMKCVSSGACSDHCGNICYMAPGEEESIMVLMCSDDQYIYKTLGKSTVLSQPKPPSQPHIPTARQSLWLYDETLNFNKYHLKSLILHVRNLTASTAQYSSSTASPE